MILLSLKPKNCSDTSLIDSVSLNIGDPSYQSSDSDHPVDVSIFETPYDSSGFGQPKYLPLSDSSTPWLGVNGFTGSVGRNFADSQEGDVSFAFDGTEMQQEYQVEQPDGKAAIFSEGSLPSPPTLIPPSIQLLEPSCPNGKKAFCCSGGKAAGNIGKGCGECMILPL